MRTLASIYGQPTASRKKLNQQKKAEAAATRPGPSQASAADEAVWLRAQNLTNQLTLIKTDNQKLKEENQTLTRMLKLQEKSLKKSDNDHNSSSVILASLMEELRVAQSQVKKYQVLYHQSEKSTREMHMQYVTVQHQLRCLMQIMDKEEEVEVHQLVRRIVALEGKLMDLKQHQAAGASSTLSLSADPLSPAAASNTQLNVEARASQKLAADEHSLEAVNGSNEISASRELQEESTKKLSVLNVKTSRSAPGSKDASGIPDGGDNKSSKKTKVPKGPSPAGSRSKLGPIKEKAAMIREKIQTSKERLTGGKAASARKQSIAKTSSATTDAYDEEDFEQVTDDERQHGNIKHTRNISEEPKTVIEKREAQVLPQNNILKPNLQPTTETAVDKKPADPVTNKPSVTPAAPVISQPPVTPAATVFKPNLTAAPATSAPSKPAEKPYEPTSTKDKARNKRGAVALPASSEPIDEIVL